MQTSGVSFSGRAGQLVAVLLASAVTAGGAWATVLAAPAAASPAATPVAGVRVSAGRNVRVVVGAPVPLVGRVTPLASIVGRGSIGPEALRATRRTARWTLVGSPHRGQGATRKRKSRLVSPQGLTALFRPTLPGRYRVRLTVRQGGEVTSSVRGVTALPPNPLVPIDTVAKTASGPGIRVGKDSYPAPAVTGSPSEVVQVLVLDRKTLAMVSNTSYTDTDALRTALSGLTDGNLVVVSLQKPAQPGNDPLRGGDLGKALAPIGFPDVTTGNRAPGSLSAVGVPKTGHGAASTDLDTTGSGMTGYLTRDRWGNYGFTSSDQDSFTTSREKPCDPTTAPDHCNDTGFRVIEIDPYTLKPIADRFFGTNERNLDAFGQDAQARAMGAFVAAIPDGVLVRIETATNRIPGEQGYRQPVGYFDPETMKNLAIIVASVGGTRNAFNRAAIETGPDDGSPVYTLLGWGHAGEGHGAEASPGVDGVDAHPILSGTLRRDRTYRFRPVQTEDFGGVSDELQQKIMAAPGKQPWPLSGDPGATRALAYVGEQEGKLGCDPRSSFWVLGLTQSEANTASATVDKVPVPPSGTIDPCTNHPIDFTDKQFEQGRSELSTELLQVANVREYMTKLSSPFSDNALQSWAQAMSISQKVYEASHVPDGSTATMRWIQFTQIILKLLGPVTAHVTPEIADLMELGVWLAGDKEDGAPGDQEVRFEAVNLGKEFVDQVDNAVATYHAMGNIVVSDADKLDEIGTHGGCTPYKDPQCPAYLALTDADTQAASAAFYRGIQRIAYQTLVPIGFRIFQLNQYPNPVNYPTRGYPSGDGSQAPAISTYECSSLFISPHPFDSNPAWPKDAQASLLQSLAPNPGARKLSQWQTLALAPPPGSSRYATAPPESLLHKMFDPVPNSDDPVTGDPGLGMSPSEFLRTAPHSGWSNEDAPGQDKCWWKVDK